MLFALFAFGTDGPNCAAQVVDGVSEESVVLAGALDPVVASPFSSFFFFFDFFFLDFLVPVVVAQPLSLVNEFSDGFLKYKIK